MLSGFENTVPRPEASAAPKPRAPVQGLWIGPLAEMQRLSIRSFLAHGHEYHLYCYERPEGVPAGARLLPAQEILPRSEVFTYQQGAGKGSYSACSNLFRYRLLFEKGGWWVDADLVCLKPFDSDPGHIFASEMASGASHVTSCAIRAPRGSPAMKACIRCCEQIRPEELWWGRTGPALLQAVVREMGLQRHVLEPRAFCPIEWKDYLRIEQGGSAPVLENGSWAIHLWQEMWRREGRPPRKDPGSLYGALCRRYGL